MSIPAALNRRIAATSGLAFIMADAGFGVSSSSPVGAGSMSAASSASEAACGVGPDFVDAIGGLSSRSGTGAACMSWVPARPAASAGVVLHFSHLMSGTGLSPPTWTQACAPLQDESSSASESPSSLGLFSHGGSFFGFFFGLLDRLRLVLRFRVLGDVRLGLLDRRGDALQGGHRLFLAARPRRTCPGR